jgi:hypothetical protein
MATSSGLRNRLNRAKPAARQWMRLIPQESKRMKYMLLIYSSQIEIPALSPEEQQAYWNAWFAYSAKADQAGVRVANEGLAPVTAAKTVRVRGGKTVVTDGPFAETHEQLGGFYLIDALNLDEAIQWAARIPGAKYGSVEVRPVMQYEPSGG